MAKQKTFSEVLSEALDDVIDNGFDKPERMEKWLERLKAAAKRTLPSEKEMEKMLRDALKARYQQLQNGEIAKLNPGVSKFTLKGLTPKMQDELTKRIMASANLIKLNRGRAIDSTLQRFAGWMSSVPAGGTDSANKKKTKVEVQKALSSLPFEDRRVIIDQGHKLVGAINEVIASNTGAIAGVWHSHWRQPGYDYREDHKERDDQVYLIRDSWADKKGFVKPGEMGWYGDTTKVNEEPFCRCYMKWIYSLRALPKEMLTAKGKVALADARAKTSA